MVRFLTALIVPWMIITLAVPCAFAGASRTTCEASFGTTNSSDWWSVSSPLAHRHDQILTDWLNNQEHGFFNPKQQVKVKLTEEMIKRRHVVSDDITNLAPRYPSYSSIGVFAKEDIAAGEVLLQVPWELVVGFEGEEDEIESSNMDDDEDDRPTRLHSSIHCGTVRNLARLLSSHQQKTIRQQKGDTDEAETTQSELSTYLDYLLDTHDHYSLPASWSQPGQNMFLQVLGGTGYRSLLMDDAFSLLEYQWLDICGGGLAAPGFGNFTMEEISAMLIRQRAISHAHDAVDEPSATWMVPLYDLYAHRNGPLYLNTKVAIREMSSLATNPNISKSSSRRIDGMPGHNNTPKRLFQLVSMHDIRAGEEIHISYTKQALTFCEEESGDGDSDDREDGGVRFLCAREFDDDLDDDEIPDYFYGEYGTPEFFADHGFIENFPQRWVLPTGELLLEKDFGGVVQTFAFPRPSFNIEVDNKPNGPQGKSIDDNVTSVTTSVDWDMYSLGWKVFVNTVLNRELRRLLRLTNVLWDREKLMATVPQHELDRIIAFHQSFADALKVSIDEIQSSIAADYEATMMNQGVEFAVRQPQQRNLSYESTSVYVLDHYEDFFRLEADDLSYNEQNCRSSELHDFLDYNTFIIEKSNYQELHFQNRESDSDLCLHLDNMLQICTSYRPHYHEFFIHYPAQFVESIKRVVFLGSGDAMLLHEILKYPNLEKVVGLELDQHVTRKSFQYFKTQPHFDDNRVEWWYGDATKTLPLLPKGYWGSFDLALVDLSETVVSMSVTEEHDVLDVISMLLQPKGVLLENELYLDKMSRYFDHVVQIFYGSPKVCTQVLTLASNGVDFLHSPLFDHGVDSYLVDFPMEQSDRFFFIHDYFKAGLEDRQLCADIELKNSSSGERKTSTKQGRKAGILEIVEAENCESSTLNEGDIEGRIRNVLIQFDLNAVNVASTTIGGFYPDDMIEPTTVIMEEGYIVARCWRKRRYCAVDVQLWGAYHKRTGLVSALTEEFRSTLVSSYRIVTGGMYETKTWEDDQQQIGIQFTNKQNCRKSYIASNEDSSPTIADLWNDSLNTLVDKMAAKKSRKLVVAVTCGAKAQHRNCWSVEWMAKHPLVSHIVDIYMCPTVDPNAAITVDVLKSMHNCERGIISQLRRMSSMEGGGMSIDVLIFDDTVDESMGLILNSILSEQSHREAFLSDNYVLVVPTMDMNETTTWRGRYLDRYRKLVRDSVVLSLAEIHMELSPMTSAQRVQDDENDMIIKSGDRVDDDGLLILGMIYCCDDHAIPIFTELEQSLRDQHQKSSGTVVVDIAFIFGGELHPPRDIVSYEQRTFPMDAYDLTDHNKQMTTQEALGRQTLVQLEPTPTTVIEELEDITNEGTMPSFDELYRYLETTVVRTMGYGPITKTEKYHGLDELGALGGIISMIYPQGNVVLVWDGQQHVDMNIFSYNQRKELHNQFIEGFCSMTGFLDVKLRDDQPRGVGRVVSFGTTEGL